MIHNKFRYILTLVALFAMTAGAWAADTYTITFSGFGNEACNKTVTDATLEYSETFNVTDVYANYINFGGVGGSNDYVSISKSQDETQITITVKSPFEGTVNVTVYYQNENWDESQSDISVTCVKSAPAGPEVTINETKTEASFEMPTSDVTVDYELVRDMSVQMQAQVGDDPAKQPRYRVQWNGENWVPADMTQQQVAALFSVNDLIEEETLAPKSYLVSIYAVNEQGETTGDPMTFLNFTFAPGRYAVKASAMLDSPTYEGTTALSNTFELFQGYEVEIAANSFATYYKDEALTIDESTAEDAALYTISEVTATEAVLSSEIEAAPKSTPLLVFNSSDKARTILLIPTNEPNLALTVAPEFMGTATGETFSEADMEAANFYVLTDANAFVWVKGAGQIAANKCWLEIPKTAPNNTRAIVFGEDATAIKSIANGQEPTANSYYDLSGRKVADGQQPKTKGLYINGGRKVVIK